MRVAMGDLSNEPSMEEILSSIKRIIAEEGDAAPRVRRAGRPAPVAEREGDEVLELNDPMPMPMERAPSERAAPERAVAAERIRPERAPVKPREKDSEDEAPAAVVPEPAPRGTPAADEPRATPEPVISQGTVNATRGALDHLSRMIVRPEAGSDGTLEGLVREMIRPMLREWFDTNLPTLVEEMVAREIGRITGSRR